MVCGWWCVMLVMASGLDRDEHSRTAGIQAKVSLTSAFTAEWDILVLCIMDNWMATCCMGCVTKRCQCCKRPTETSLWHCLLRYYTEFPVTALNEGWELSADCKERNECSILLLFNWWLTAPGLYKTSRLCTMNVKFGVVWGLFFLPIPVNCFWPGTRWVPVLCQWAPSGRCCKPEAACLFFQVCLTHLKARYLCNFDSKDMCLGG